MQIGNQQEKLLQYADDTNIWSIYEKDSINEIIAKLDKFYRNTGLKTNFEKTVLYLVGAQKTRKRMYLDAKFKWSDKCIDTLGLVIATDGMDTEITNYVLILEKANGILQSWQQRPLSLIGKIEVVNTLVNLLFVYKMQVLPTISKALESKIHAIVSRFIWNARKPKIRKEFLEQTHKRGGRQLSNLILRDMSLKIQWVQRLHSADMDPTITYLAYFFLLKLRSTMSCSGNVTFQKKMPIGLKVNLPSGTL